MSTWSGWQNQFLLAAKIIETPPNRQFLTDWAKHASSPQCKRNPIDLHVKVGGSTNCDHPAGFPDWTQAYTTHAHAATAFADQVNSNQFAAILDTLGTGNPYQDPGWKAVVAALKQWPSVNFAAWFEQQMSKSGGGGGGGGGTKASHTHHGWKDLRKSVNHNLPVAIKHSTKLTNAALRSLKH